MMRVFLMNLFVYLHECGNSSILFRTKYILNSRQTLFYSNFAIVVSNNIPNNNFILRCYTGAYQDYCVANILVKLHRQWSQVVELKIKIMSLNHEISLKTRILYLVIFIYIKFYPLCKCSICNNNHSFLPDSR